MKWQFFSVLRGRPFGLTRNDVVLDEQPCKCAPENSSPAKALLAPVPGLSFGGSFCKRRLIGLARPTLPLRQFGGSAICHYNSSPLGMPPTAFHYTPERTRFVASDCLSASHHELPTAPQASQNEHLHKNTRGEGCYVTVPIRPRGAQLKQLPLPFHCKAAKSVPRPLSTFDYELSTVGQHPLSSHTCTAVSFSNISRAHHRSPEVHP